MISAASSAPAAPPLRSRPSTTAGDGAFDDPALGQHDEFLQVAAPDDLDVDGAADRLQAILELGALVAGIGIELEQEGIQAEQRAHQQHAAVTVLQVGGMDNGLHQQALRVDEDVPLLSFDLLASVVARRIDRAPPFSAPLTLWLSMIAAVGLASRPACSRHWT